MSCNKFFGWRRRVPLPVLRDWLLLRHAASCPACREDPLDMAPTRKLLAPPAWVEAEPSLWPGVAAGIARARERDLIRLPMAGRTPARCWLAAAAVVVVLCVPVWLGVRSRPRPLPLTVAPAVEPGPAFTLVSATIDGRPATPYIVHAPGSDLVIVWLERTVN